MPTWFGVVWLLSIVALVLWVWALVDAVRVPDDGDYRSGNKLVWVLIIALTGVVGALIYFAIGRPSGGASGASGAGGPNAGAGSVERPPPPPPPPPDVPSA